MKLRIPTILKPTGVLFLTLLIYGSIAQETRTRTVPHHPDQIIKTYTTQELQDVAQKAYNSGATATNNTINTVNNNPAPAYSPEAETATRFKDIPVNLNGGAMSVPIPLYTLTEGKLSVPISLLHNGSGMKNQEAAGWCGVNNTLISGGMITRVSKGIPDEGVVNGTTNYRGYYRYGFNPAMNSDHDTEPDMLYIQINGQSYTCQYRYYGVNPQFETFPLSDIIIKPNFTLLPNNTVVGKFNSFEVIMPDGTHYFFGENDAQETTAEAEVHDIQDGDNFVGSTGFTNFWKNNAQTSVWYLTKIVSAYGQEITFTYDHLAYSYYKIGEHGVSGTNGVCPNSSQVEKKLNRVFVSGASLAKITGKNTKVEFNKRYRVCYQVYDPISEQNIEQCEYQDTSPARLDLDAWSRYPQSQSNAKKLIEMMVMENTATPQDTLFYKFNYGYFSGVEDDLPVGYTTADVGTTHQKRLRLEQIKFPDNTSVRFRYRGDAVGYNGKSRLNFGIDHWDYANGYTSNRLLTGLIPRDSDYPTCTAQTSNRETDLAFSFYGSLDSLIYEGRKVISFDYEVHSARNYLNADSSYKPIGGPRIKRIISKDLISGIETQKNYEYLLSNGKSSGFLIMKPTYRFKSTFIDQIGSNSHLYTRLLNEVSRLPVTYSRVTEKITDNQNTNLGKTVYYFPQRSSEISTKWTNYINCTGTYPNQVCDTVDYLMPELIRPQSNRMEYPYDAGTVLKTEVFNANNDTLSVQEWAYVNAGGIQNGAATRVFKINGNLQLGYNATNNFYYQGYYQEYVRYRLKSEKSTLYSQTGTNPVSTTTEYKYRDEVTVFPDHYIQKHNFPTLTHTIDSRGKYINNIIKYPIDISFGLDTTHYDQTCYDENGSYDCSYDLYTDHVPALGTRARGIFEFQDKHIWAFPIETNTSINNTLASASHATISSFNNSLGGFNYAAKKSFSIGNDAYGSQDFFKLEYNRALQDTIIIDSRFKEQGQIDEYNAYGLPTKSHSLGGAVSITDYDSSLLLPIRTRYNVGGVIVDTASMVYTKKLFGASKQISINGLNSSVVYDTTYRKGAVKQILDKDKNILAQYDYLEPNESFVGNGLSIDPSKVRTISRVPRFAVKKLPSNTDSLQINLSYSDGEGRTLQNKSIKASPNKKDVVSGVGELDSFGRPLKNILPIPTNSTSGAYEPNVLTTAQSFYADNSPFSEIKQYEASPLSRPLKSMGVGQALRPNKEGSQVFETGNFGIKQYSVNGYLEELYLYIDTYVGNQVLKTTTTDEQGNKTLEFTDKEGRKLETHVQFTGDGTQPQHYLKTAYIYDRLGRFAGVIPPLAYDRVANGLSILNSSITNLLYLVRYDTDNRVRQKHVPDSGWSYFVYNRLGQLVMSQNPLQRSTNLWVWSKYDARGKVIMSGTLTNSTFSQQDLQTKFDTYTELKQFEERNTNTDTYTARSFPTDIQALITANDIKTINFYDDYTWQSGNALAFQKYKTNRWSNSKGLLTGNKVRRLDTGQWLSTALYYDDQNRLIQSQSENRFSVGGIPSVNQTDIVLDFIGKVLEERTLYRKPAQATIESKTAYTYDFAGRKTQATHFWNGKSEILASYEYNELGQLIRKRLNEAYKDSIIRANETLNKGVIDVAKKYVLLQPGTLIKPDSTYCAYISTGLQNVDYSYNIQGSLRGINLTPSGALDSNKVFSLKLDYLEDARYFNGLLSKQTWKSQQDTTTRSYQYDYDKANRIAKGIFLGQNLENYSLQKISYDDNGNIDSLQRYGKLANGGYGMIDDLKYQYYQHSNKLSQIDDNAQAQIGFKDVSGSNEFQYITGGHQQSDGNKGISNTLYNYLGLVSKIEFGANKYIEFIYTSDGIRLSTKFVDGTTILTKDYIGDLIYINDTLRSVWHDDGRIVFDNNKNGTYQYFINDQQGSTRVVFQKLNGNVYIAQRIDYGVSGEIIAEQGSGQNLLTHLYQGKEWIDGLGFDFITRVYDPYTARMLQIDGANQFASGFVGMGNNPVNGIDPDGQFWHIVAGAAIGGAINLGVKAFQGKIHNFRDGAVAFGIGAVAGGLTAATGGAASVYASTGSFAGAFSSTAVAASSTGIIGGAIAGATGSATGGLVQGIGNAAYFGDAYSAKDWAIGVGFGAFTGGAIGGITAKVQGLNVLNGSTPDKSGWFPNFGKVKWIKTDEHGWKLSRVSVNESSSKFPNWVDANGKVHQGGSYANQATNTSITSPFSKENISGYYIFGNKGIIDGNIYQRNIQALAELEGNSSIIRLVKDFETEALSNGANAIEINGLSIENFKLMNSSMANRLGYSYEQVSKNSIRLFKSLR